MKKREKIHRIIMLSLGAVMALILIFGKNNRQEQKEEDTTTVETVSSSVSTGAAIWAAPQPTAAPEEEVYSFFQGPKMWKERREWSGEWGKEVLDGKSFGAFGCGFCGMANIYSTLTKYEASPTDIYEFSKARTEYGGGGAVSWGFMRQTMAGLGFQVEFGEKPPTFAGFKEAMERTEAMLVLVSSAADDSYWQNTPGHYVTLFLYDSERGDVFLTDSGDPSHNRQRVPLKTVYKALKTSSELQYMSVLSYDESADGLKSQTAGGTWVRPEGTNKAEADSKDGYPGL